MPKANLEPCRKALLAQAEKVVLALLGEPAKRQGDEWIYPAFYRTDKHPSLRVSIAKHGIWIDDPTHQGGDLFDLAGLKLDLDPKSQFPKLLIALCKLIGIPGPSHSVLATDSRAVPDTDKLARYYGLEWADYVKQGCKVAKRQYSQLDGKSAPAVVYPLETLDGKPGNKYRSVERLGAKGKRLPNCDKGAKGFFPVGQVKGSGILYVTAGEEKALALLKCGVRAVSASIGEGNLSMAFAEYLVQSGNRQLGVAMDGDAQGQKANQFAAKNLLKAGAESVVVVPLPQDKDINDVLTASGIEAVQGLIGAAQPYKPDALQSEPVPENPYANNSDIGNAGRLVLQHGDNLRFVPEMGWMFWDCQCWQRDTGNLHVQEMAKVTALSIYGEVAKVHDDKQRDELVKWAKRSCNRRQVESMLALARSNHSISALATDFDRDPMLLCVANGELDLATGTLHPHRRTSYCSKCIPIVYDPHARSDEWEQFLFTILAGDMELIAYMQKAVGYCLTGHAREQCFFIAYGAGQNGKSTFIEVILALTGDYGAKTAGETFLDQKPSAIRNDLARLHGKRFAAGVETGKDRKLDVAVVKELTGQDKITARLLYHEPFEFYPEFKIMIATNHRPRIDDSGDAIWRRVRMIPFTVKIPDNQRDYVLLERLRQPASLTGILNWAVKGSVAWCKEGLKDVPKAVLELNADYRREEDRFESFLFECCDRSPDKKIPVERLRSAYNRWASSSGEIPMTLKQFSRTLKERGIERRTSTGGFIFCIGLCLKKEIVEQGEQDDQNGKVSLIDGPIGEVSNIVQLPQLGQLDARIEGNQSISEMEATS